MKSKIERIATIIVIFGLVFMAGVYCGAFYAAKKFQEPVKELRVFNWTYEVDPNER